MIRHRLSKNVPSRQVSNQRLFVVELSELEPLQSNFFPSLDEAGLMGRAEALVDIGKHPGGAHGIKHPDMGSMSMYHHAMGSTTQSPHNTAR